MKTSEEIIGLTDLAYTVIKQSLVSKDANIRLKAALDLTQLITMTTFIQKQEDSKDIGKEVFRQIGLVAH
jgi:hypothetical protein